jgi:hypothetical protein
MFEPFAVLLLLTPANVAEASVERSVFPKGADSWDRIGLYTLKDGDKERLVLLYYHDSDTVADKEFKKNGHAIFVYPNSFVIHAVYKDKTGKWKHEEVTHSGRINFTKVVEAASDHVTLECRHHFPWDTKLATPMYVRISFAYGVLIAD